MYNCFDISKQFLDLARAENKTITPMELLKLVYIAHGYNLGFNKGPLIKNTIQAWKFGPVIPDLYNVIKRFGDRPVDPDLIDLFKHTDLTSEDKHFVSLVWNAYKHLNGLQLSTLTHLEGTPWSRVYNNGGYNSIISNDIIEEYYKTMIRERSQSNVAQS